MFKALNMFKRSLHHFSKDVIHKTLKYWVVVQWGQSYLMGRRSLFSLGWWSFWWWCCSKNTLWSRYFITSTSTSSFPFGLFKTESDFISRSVKAGLERWMLVVVVVSVNAYFSLAFSDLTCHLEDTGMSGCTVLRGSKETKVGWSDQEASPLAGKNIGVVLVPCRTWKCGPTAISSGADISEVPGCYLLQ